jgi:hypothetical protein
MALEELPVLAGLDTILKFEGEVVGWATNVSADEDFELQGVRTLGKHGDRGYKSQGYNCSITVGSFGMFGDILDRLPTPNRRNILKSGMIDMEVVGPVGANGEEDDAETLWTFRGCKCGTKGINIDSGTLITKTTTWRCMEVIENRLDNEAGGTLNAVS